MQWHGKMGDVTPINVLTKWRGDAVTRWCGKMREVTPINVLTKWHSDAVKWRMSLQLMS